MKNIYFHIIIGKMKCLEFFQKSEKECPARLSIRPAVDVVDRDQPVVEAAQFV